jgi:hypothetical protein
MPKLEYKSDSDDDDKTEVVETTDGIKPSRFARVMPNGASSLESKQLETTDGIKPVKKPRTQKQIEATNKMREALKARTENNKKLKEDLEAKMDDTLNHKLIKKEINKKVNMKLKQIVDTTNDDVSDSDEEIIIIPKRKVVKPKATQVKAEPKVKAEPPPPQIQKQQGFAIRFV